jgi:hypothetical protein
VRRQETGSNQRREEREREEEKLKQKVRKEGLRVNSSFDKNE